MGQTLAAARFYAYGRQEFTRTGWLAHSAAYPKPDALRSADYRGRVALVTGGNSGVGREVATYLASKGGIVYMLCRNAERAAQARDEIAKLAGSGHVHALIGDCGLASDMRRIAAELREREASLHCLVCNAGEIMHERTMTSEGHEVTFATQLLNGVYVLSQELLPLLRKSYGARVVCVSSGGMYAVGYDHSLASSASGTYDGQLNYARVKRGQVLLCEHFGRDPAEPVAFVSCHPGWVDTPAVQRAYGSSKWFLEPIRSTWEGAEGICWLCTAPAAELERGAFYLDRSPQPKDLVSWTASTEQDASALVATLAEAAAAQAAIAGVE